MPYKPEPDEYSDPPYDPNKFSRLQREWIEQHGYMRIFKEAQSMTQKEFIKYLQKRNISFTIEKDIIIINGGNVYLYSLTSLPENVQFNNGGSVYLYSCKSIPENVQFNNGGSVYLRSCKSIPENVQFNNGGDVYLRSCKSIPENVQFNNGGDVDLRSCTSLPENVQFNNGGYINLDSCKSVPENVQFNNGGSVYLYSCTSLPENVQFNNGGYVDLYSCTSLSENVQFNNGGDVDLRSCTSLPENVQFNNGGSVYLKDNTISINIPYLERYKIPIIDDHVILYKKVSKDYKTQEGTANETTWALRTTLEHSNWDPSLTECGAGKFHACAKPRWCDMFRNEKDDKYIAVRIHVQDLYEWTNNPSYPQKIGFRRGYVVGEVERNIDKQ